MAIRDWIERFGFVLAKNIKYTPKDLECSARYVSKYCCKGVFENPFRSTVRFDSKFPIIFERSRSQLCGSNEIVPFIFTLSSKGQDCFEQETFFKGWTRFQGLLFGRGASKEVRYSWSV